MSGFQPSPGDDRHAALVCVVAGASGRIGRHLLALIADSNEFELAGTWTRTGAPDGGGRCGAEPAGEPARPARVLIDFSAPAAFDAVLDWCLARRVALVSGTTGLAARQRAALDAAADRIPVLWSANFSLGAAVLARLAAEAARALPDWDAHIVEAHRAGKRDAPSGTALALADALAVVTATGARPVPIASIRAGDIVGDHTVWLVAAGERLELIHRAGDRAVFARGALHAARWLAGQAPGCYRFQDTLD